MANTASISANVAGRYAQAVFDIAREQGDFDLLAGQVDDLGRALSESEDLRTLTTSPLYSREEQGRAIGAVAERMGLSPVLANTLRIMARNNRLFAVPELVRSLKSLVAEARGEVTAEVVSSAPLTQEQERRLTETLAQKSGKTVKLDARVDDTLIGGMIVKLGSQMIDSSIRSKLASLQNVMKEVG